MFDYSFNLFFADANLEAIFVKHTNSLTYLFSFNTKNNGINGS